MSAFKSGFIALIGRPNVGKSTLLNYLARRKLAIISNKPQTTRHSIRGVVNTDDAQIVFIDTPGLHKPKDSLGSYLNQVVMKTLHEVDAVAFVLDASQTIGQGDCYIAEIVKKAETPVFLLLNKIDLINEKYLETQKEVSSHLGDFKKQFTISSVTGKGINDFLDELVRILPEGPKYYPDDMDTDQPEQALVAELIREKAIDQAREEVPYSIAVEVDEMNPREGKELVDIYANIYVEKESQKAIMIGKQGRVLKQIGKSARREIEALLGSQVNLQLMVKLKKKWRKDEEELKRLGYK